VSFFSAITKAPPAFAIGPARLRWLPKSFFNSRVLGIVKEGLAFLLAKAPTSFFNQSTSSRWLAVAVHRPDHAPFSAPSLFFFTVHVSALHLSSERLVYPLA